VSKDRARRRAVREAAAVVEREQRSRSGRRRRRRAVVGATLAWPLTRVRAARKASVDSALARRRSRENGTLLAVLLGVNALVWLVEPSWGWRVSAIVLSLMAWPVLAVLLFDRRPSR
jgi:hypothetical protein